MNDSTNEIEQIEEYIRQARFHEARQSLRRLANRKGLTLETLVKAANFYRRLGMYNSALRRLAPHMSRDRDGHEPASAALKCEYAANLLAGGGLFETKRVLNSVSQSVPEKFLIAAFVNFNEWNYEAAIPQLRDYIEATIGYRRWVGQANLIAALIYEGSYEAAESELRQLRETDGVETNRLLSVHLHRLDGMRNWSMGRLAQASESLERAQNLALDSDRETFLIRKWRLLLDLKSHKSPNLDQGLHQLAELRDESYERGDWETYRDLCFHETVFTRNLDRAYCLARGTPYPHYRKRLYERIDTVAPANFCDPNYSIVLGKRGLEFSGDARSDARGATTIGSQLPQLDALLTALCFDYFRPARVLEIHERVFPGTYFNPNSSPNRIRQLLHRLRKELPRGLAIKQDAASYRLTSSTSRRIHLPQPQDATNPHPMPWWQDLRDAFEKLSSQPETACTLLELARAARGSPRTVSRQLNKLCEARLVERVGNGRYTSYKLVA